LKLFIPNLEEGIEPQEFYNKMKAIIENQGHKILEDKIYRIKFKHEGDVFEAIVGEYEPYDGAFFKDKLLVIFKTDISYLAFSSKRGLYKPFDPIFIGFHDVIEIEHFIN